MSYFFAAALYALFVWWFSTGAILLFERIPSAGPVPWRALGGSLLLSLGLLGLVHSVSDPSILGAYLAFTSAVFVWGWHEMVFLGGWLTGPRREACPANAHGWRRFWYATEVVLHHELALFATLWFLVALVWDQANQVGMWTFLVLWVMRVSAELNIFLGVRNVTKEFIPARLHYMTSYFRTRRYNPLMPVSLTLSLVALGVVLNCGLNASASSQAAAGAGLVGTMLALAALEHVFLMLPGPDVVLWRWALGKPGPV